MFNKVLSPSIKKASISQNHASHRMQFKLAMHSGLAARVLPLTITLLLSACASTVKYQEPKLIITESNNTATLHVIRKNSAWGAAIPAPVYVDKTLIGRIGPGGRLDVKIPEGRSAVSSTTSDVILDAKPGMEYFIEVSMPMQVWLMTPNFDVKIIEKQ